MATIENAVSKAVQPGSAAIETSIAKNMYLVGGLKNRNVQVYPSKANSFKWVHPWTKLFMNDRFQSFTAKGLYGK